MKTWEEQTDGESSMLKRVVVAQELTSATRAKPVWGGTVWFD